jgi:hypothetical protein
MTRVQVRAIHHGHYLSMEERIVTRTVVKSIAERYATGGVDDDSCEGSELTRYSGDEVYRLVHPVYVLLGRVEASISYLHEGRVEKEVCTGVDDLFDALLNRIAVRW